MKMREKINFKRLEEISLERIQVLSGDNGESKNDEHDGCQYYTRSIMKCPKKHVKEDFVM